MLTRRRFNASLAALGSAAVLPAMAAAAGPAPLLFVHDMRLLDAQRAALAAPRGTIALHGFEGDVSALWRDVLAPAWRERRLAVAGHTRHAECFVITTLARDAGYRLAERHERPADVDWLLVPDTGARALT